MSKAVLISIRPKWCELIASGKKTVEIRKTRPKLETPFKCYIYCTKWVKNLIRGDISTTIDYVAMYGGKVIGEFVCDTILRNCEMANADIAEAQSCVKREKILEYSGGHEVFGWHVSKLVIYDKPKELCEFSPDCKYKNDDGTCPSKKVACSYQREYFNPDGSVCVVECGKRIERPPQSWCYVEDLDDEIANKEST